MARPSLRNALLEAGLRVLWTTGYANTGVRDIVAAAGARPGSFTNHFASKEAFAEEVLDGYFAYLRGLVEAALAKRDLRPAERLRHYLDVITEKAASRDFEIGCLIGDLSLEAPPHSERLRLRLEAIFAEWRGLFAACIAEGQAEGEITRAFTADDLADFLIASWEGALLRMKVERSAAPLERFKAIVFATVFGKPQP